MRERKQTYVYKIKTREIAKITILKMKKGCFWGFMETAQGTSSRRKYRVLVIATLLLQSLLGKYISWSLLFITFLKRMAYKEYKMLKILWLNPSEMQCKLGLRVKKIYPKVFKEFLHFILCCSFSNVQVRRERLSTFATQNRFHQSRWRPPLRWENNQQNTYSQGMETLNKLIYGNTLIFILF